MQIEGGFKIMNSIMTWIRKYNWSAFILAIQKVMKVKLKMRKRLSKVVKGDIEKKKSKYLICTCD